MLRVTILNSESLRSALVQCNLTARLSDAEWKALLGLQVRLQSAWVRERRAALRAALLDARLPGPLQSLIRAGFWGRDFSDEELRAEISAAVESWRLEQAATESKKAEAKALRDGEQNGDKSVTGGADKGTA